MQEALESAVREADSSLLGEALAPGHSSHPSVLVQSVRPQPDQGQPWLSTSTATQESDRESSGSGHPDSFTACAERLGAPGT
jgi:hypothetical protein